MGVSISSHDMEQAARRRSKTIDDSLEAERLRQARTVRVLMLGLSGAGKSTLAKQVRIIHERGFTDKEIAYYKDLLRHNLAQVITGVLGDMHTQGFQLATEEVKQIASTLQNRLKGKDAASTIVDLRQQVMTLTSQKEIWKFIEERMDVESSILACYLLRSQERILTESYTPTDLDILRARQKTSGLNEVMFHFKGFEFRLCDVDGQCSVKKKWLQNFEMVSAILFTASLASYATKSRDHDGQTELHDAIRVFKTVCNHKGFENTPVILLLNKVDVFQQLLKKRPLTTAFPEYTGTSDQQEATKFIEDRFKSSVEDSSPDRLSTHVTNATDTPSTRIVFDASLAVVLEKA